MPQGPAIFQRLSRIEQLGLLALLALVVVIGAITVKRTALGWMRRGDFGVYARAGWAVRTGGDLRTIECDRKWHYVYPPTLAVLMVPLADPPASERPAVAVPYAVSAGIWYLINVLCLLAAVHMLASALEQTSPDPLLRASSPRCRGWWQLRLFPVLACLPVVGETLTRGQVNTILLVLVCGFIAGMLRGNSARGGFCLAGAICLKFIPAFLLLIPGWRRDGRCLLGCAAGLIILGMGIPMLGLGVEGTLNDYRRFYEIVLAPGVGASKSAIVNDELTNIVCGHSQSTMGMVHTWMHPERPKRPDLISPWVRRAHWLVGGNLVLLALGAGLDQFGWRRRSTAQQPMHGMSAGTRLTLFTGTLLLNMLILSPMCHSHYLCLAIPTFMALVFWDFSQPRRWLSRGLIGLMIVFVAANCIPMIPGLMLLDDGGMAGLAMLLVWTVGAVTMWQTRTQSQQPEQHGTSSIRRMHRRSQAASSASFNKRS